MIKEAQTDEVSMLKKQLAETEAREKELASQLEGLTDFIENASIPLHWVNGSGIIIWANQAELELLGYTKEEYIGKHIASFHANRETIEDILARLIRKETLKNYPATLRCKNGNIIPVLINSNVRWNGSEFVHTRCFTREITDLKQLEAKKVELINELQETIKTLKAENEALKKQVMHPVERGATNADEAEHSPAIVRSMR